MQFTTQRFARVGLWDRIDEVDPAVQVFVRCNSSVNESLELLLLDMDARLRHDIGAGQLPGVFIDHSDDAHLEDAPKLEDDFLQFRWRDLFTKRVLVSRRLGCGPSKGWIEGFT